MANHKRNKPRSRQNSKPNRRNGWNPRWGHRSEKTLYERRYRRSREKQSLNNVLNEDFLLPIHKMPYRC